MSGSLGLENDAPESLAAPVGPFQPWRYLYRVPLLLILCVLGLPLLLLALAPGIRDIPAGGKPLWWRVQRRYARMLVAVLGMRLRVIGELPKPPYLVVSNHISWFDIPLLHALEPMWLVAVASVENGARGPSHATTAARDGIDRLQHLETLQKVTTGGSK